MAKGKNPSGEGSLPLGEDPKLDLDASKAAEEAELAAMIAEETAKAEADAKAQAEAKAAEPEALSERDHADHEAEKAEREAIAARPSPLRTAEPRLVTTDAGSDADSEDEEPGEGPRVQVWPHGAINWDSAVYEPGKTFRVDTSKHREEDFDSLVAMGALIKL